MDVKGRTMVALALLPVLAGCSGIRIANEPFRTETVMAQCRPDGSDCTDRVIELHEGYSLGFVEFTERGNEFSRERTRSIYQHVMDRAADPRGVAVIVFVHGWKHNARWDDTNVQDFRTLLADFASRGVNGNRHVVGVYIGWRGMSYDIPGFKELTYWDRKAVAEEVGSGGVTHVLTALKRIVVGAETDSTEAPKNAYLVIGHSFGGAIVLSALHDVLTENLTSSVWHVDDAGRPWCNVTDRIADGVVLLNPAIEANRILQIKEIGATCRFPWNQPKLLHVISSDGDRATSRAFKVGQWLNLVLTWNQEKLDRTFGDKTVTLDEQDLDTETIGNYPLFRTGRLESNRQEGNRGGPKWRYTRCDAGDDSLGACGLAPAEIPNHIPVNDNDPLVFIKTDGAFIRDHNDVFNCDVKSYLATITLEGQSKKRPPPGIALLESVRRQDIPSCRFDGFEFGGCLEGQLESFGCQVPSDMAGG